MIVMVTVVMGGFKASSANAAASAGDLIKMDGLSSIYYLGADGKRYVFPNEATYFSWYKDFSGVVTVPASELQSYPLGSNITMRPGTKLVKITTDPKVYAVEPGGVLRYITSETQAKALYGDNWNKKVVDVADAFFTNYATGSALADNTYPAGTLVKKTGTSDVYYFDGSNYRKIASEAAFYANKFNFDNVVTTSIDFTASGDAINSAEANLADTSQGGKSTPGTQPGQGTGLTVALASDTPAAMSVPVNTSVEVLKLNLTASNDGDINVNGIKFSAAGLGSPSDIKAVTVYNKGVKWGNSKDIDSNKVAQINFTSPLIVKSGTTESIVVKAKVAGTNQYALKIAAAADIVTSGVTVAGSFPVTGNNMSGVSVVVGALTVATDGSLSAVKLGDKAATLAKIKVDADSVEDITLKSISLKRDSSVVNAAADDDFENVTLYMDGAAVSAATSISNKYVTFNLTTPVTILKSNMKRFVVKGDVVDGAGKTIKLILDSVSDVSATGNYYNYNSIITNSMTGVSVTINAGTVALEKVNATQEKVKKDTKDVEFGTLKITANSGKNIEMSTIKFTVTATSEDTVTAGGAYDFLENVKLVDKTTNTSYDLNFDSSAGATSKVYSNTGDTITLTNGVTKEFAIKGDINNSASITTPSYAFAITSASSDVVMKETGNDTTISDITPNSVSWRKVSVITAAPTFSMNALSTSINAVVGSSDIEIANFNVKANEASDLKLTELKLVDEVGGTTVDKTVVSEFKLYKGTSLIKTVSANDVSSEVVTFSDLNQTLTANTTATFKVTTSLVKDSVNNGKSMKFRISGYSIETTDKGTAVYDTTAENVLANGVVAVGETGATSLLSARTVNINGIGILYVSMDNTQSATDADTFQIAGTDSSALASLKLRAANDDIKVTKLSVTAPVTGTFTANLNQVISSMSLYDGSTLIATTSNITNPVVFEGLSIVVPQSSKIYTLKAKLNAIGKDQSGALDQDITFHVDAIEAQSNSTGDTMTAGNANGAVAAGEIVYDTNNDGTFDAGGETLTGESKKLGSVASMISGVSLVSSVGSTTVDSNISSGIAANAAIIKVTTPDYANTLASGEELKTMLSRIKVKVAHGSTVTAITATIEKIGGTQAAITATDDETYATFAVSGNDYSIAKNSTVYYLVKVTPTFAATPASIKVSLDNLDGTAAANDATGSNFSWKDGFDAGGRLQLRIPDTTKVDGAQLNNIAS
jgi:hypothetical protein